MRNEESKSPKDSKTPEILDQSVFTESIETKHYRKMRSAIWLYLYLAERANRKTGELMTNLKAISADMAIPRVTIQRWLKRLRSGGCVETASTGRLLTIRMRINNDVSRVSRMMPLMHQEWNSRCIKNDPAHYPEICPKSANFKQKMTINKKNQKPAPIDKSINNKLNIDIDKENPPASTSGHHSPIGYEVKTKTELLALDLATTLDDIQALPLYISYARKYPEHFLRRILGVVREIPPEKVKRSRGALFNFLVQKHGRQNKNNSRD